MRGILTSQEGLCYMELVYAFVLPCFLLLFLYLCLLYIFPSEWLTYLLTYLLFYYISSLIYLLLYFLYFRGFPVVSRF